MGYIAEIFYFLSIGLCKASLLLFIIRLTPSDRMALVSRSVLVFCALSTTASFLVSCLQCVPASYLWNQLDPALRGTITARCLDQKALQISLPAINIGTDLVVWVLPVKMVWNIHLPRRERWSLIAVFSCGGL